MAAPNLTITTIAGQDVSGGGDADITPANWDSCKLVGAVQHGNGKPITAMWYYINGEFRNFILYPDEAGDPAHTAAVPWSHFFTSGDFPPGGMQPLPVNGDYTLRVYALNEDGTADQTRAIHVKNF